MKTSFKRCTKIAIKAIESGIESTNVESFSGGRSCQWRASKCKNGKCVEYYIDQCDGTIYNAKIISEAKKINYGA